MMPMKEIIVEFICQLEPILYLICQIWGLEMEQNNRTKQHDVNTRRLIEAALACAEIAERHMDHEIKRTRLMQEAVKLSCSGKSIESRAKLAEAKFMGRNVFDYTDVHGELIMAANAFKSSTNST